MKTSLAILIAIASFFPYKAYAQKSFEKAYVILVSGDTIRGTINNRDWKINPKTVEFVSDAGVKSTYTPAEITWFRLEESNEDFRGISMMIDKSPTDPARVTEESHLASADENLFLRVLIQGELKLLHSYDFKNHFYYEKDGVVTELLYQFRLMRANNPNETDVSVVNQKLNEEYRKSGDILLLKRQEKYKFQLINLFADCKNMLPQLQKLQFSEKALKKIFVDYYKCKSMYLPAQKKTGKGVKAQVGVMAGVTKTNQTVTTDATSIFFLNNKTANSMSPTFGINLMLASARNRGKFAGYSEVLFQKYELSSQHQISNSAYRTDFESSYNFKNVNFALGARYHFLHSKLKPFIGAGLSLRASLQAEVFTLENKTRHDATVPEPYETTRINHPTGKSQFGTWGSIGLNYQRISLETRITRPNSWSGVMGLDVSMTQLIFLLSYRLY